MRIRTALLIFVWLACGPVAARSAPISGRWEGVFHGGRGDQPVVLICRPGADGTLGGSLYMGGDRMGPLEKGVVAGDSLHFQVMNFVFRGRRAADAMALELDIAHGRTHVMSLHYASPDTADLAPSAEQRAGAQARAAIAWDQVPDSVWAAHRIAPGAPTGSPPELRRGTLLLVGGGPSQDDVNAEFVRRAGGANARIVVIPTAGVEPGQDADAVGSADRWARALGVSHVTVLHAISRQQADDEAFVRPLAEATGVWLPGGEAGRILVKYLGTRTERALKAVLSRGGVIGGTSAGALVWGSDCQVFRAPADGSPFQMGDPAALILDDPHSVCFGALGNVIVAPHFTEFRMSSSLAKTLAASPRLLGIGIDEATAFEVRGNVGTVLGRGQVTVWDGRHADAPSLTLQAGARYDVARRAAL